jgi:hypothetical protein
MAQSMDGNMNGSKKRITWMKAITFKSGGATLDTEYHF